MLYEVITGAPDDSGRRRPTEVEGSEFEIETDVAIVAVGNGPNPIVQRSTPGMETSRVITSYSIHYTKLYDLGRGMRTLSRRSCHTGLLLPRQ